ncbi:MAG: YbaK/EbsC family protein [Casimicrobiaceae bacterium]
MKPARHPTALRIAALLEAAGVRGEVVEFDQPTRTSADAAAAIGCTVSEIAKSIVFRGAESGNAVVVVASGGNRVSEEKVAACIGERIARGDADFVRERTGYAIGGVAPVGLPPEVTVLLDEGLRQFTTVWAAAGTPFSVVSLVPDQLPALTGGAWSTLAV